MAVTKYIYDGDNVLLETDGSGVTQKEYTSSANGYGDLLSAYDGSSAKYFEPDALGSTDALTDATQAVTDRWKYRAFGAATHTNGVDTNPFTWVGRLGYLSDSETGLNILGSGTRYYDPATAQFLSDDPIGYFEGDINTRKYVRNDPINSIDPSGLQTKPAPPKKRPEDEPAPAKPPLSPFNPVRPILPPAPYFPLLPAPNAPAVPPPAPKPIGLFPGMQDSYRSCIERALKAVKEKEERIAQLKKDIEYWRKADADRIKHGKPAVYDGTIRGLTWQLEQRQWEINFLKKQVECDRDSLKQLENSGK